MSRIMNPTVSAKAKVSVSVRDDLLREVDRMSGRQNRSAVFEQALAWWLRRRKQAALDEAIEAYYRAMGDSEKAEDENWAELGDETVRRRWE